MGKIIEHEISKWISSRMIARILTISFNKWIMFWRQRENLGRKLSLSLDFVCEVHYNDRTTNVH